MISHALPFVGLELDRFASYHLISAYSVSWGTSDLVVLDSYRPYKRNHKSRLKARIAVTAFRRAPGTAWESSFSLSLPFRRPPAQAMLSRALGVRHAFTRLPQSPKGNDCYQGYMLQRRSSVSKKQDKTTVHRPQPSL